MMCVQDEGLRTYCYSSVCTRGEQRDVRGKCRRRAFFVEYCATRFSVVQ